MIYIDSYNAPYGRMIMCHMIADTKEELLEMADKIGVNKKWIQAEDTYHMHFDVCLKMKAKALTLGAIEVSNMELGRMLVHKREKMIRPCL